MHLKKCTCSYSLRRKYIVNLYPLLMHFRQDFDKNRTQKVMKVILIKYCFNLFQKLF